jgi:ribonuclease P protein component
LAFRKETLTGKPDIKALFQSGKRLASKNIAIFYRPNSKNCIRILYCSDKTSKTAVQRNRVKRVLRALFQSLDLGSLPSVDIAVKASYSFTEIEYALRQQMVKSLISKIKYE